MVLIVIVFLAGVGVGYYIRLNVGRKQTKKVSQTEHLATDYSQTAEECNSKHQEVDNSLAAEEMRQHAKDFYGCFNALNIVAQGNTKYRRMTLGDWGQRMQNKQRFPELSSYWDRLFGDAESISDDLCIAKAKEFMHFIDMCGIHHDTVGDTMLIGPTARQTYSGMDEKEWIEGSSKKIRIPAWYFGELVLEKGVLM
jgi:hypothetical protein